MSKKHDPSVPAAMYLDDEDVIGELPEPKLPVPRQFSTILTNLRDLENDRYRVTAVLLADGIEYSRQEVDFKPMPVDGPDIDLQLDAEVVVDDPQQIADMTKIWIDSNR